MVVGRRFSVVRSGWSVRVVLPGKMFGHGRELVGDLVRFGDDDADADGGGDGGKDKAGRGGGDLEEACVWFVTTHMC